jgi:hypothetical protein
MPFVCEFGTAAVGCPPPSPPPPPPPLPPSPPSPPAPPTCAPAQNSTFFCQQTLAKCYLLRSSAATYLSAQTTCSGLGGSLAQFRSRDEQLMVESTFKATGMLPTQAYWIGLSRDSADAFWQYADSGEVQQMASNYAPYAHWSYNMPSYSYDAAKPTWNCIQVAETSLLSAG